jgi:hypothetical protein
MATNVADRRYRICYEMFLRLYPQRFRERFGEGMVQTFHDLYREHRVSQRGLLSFTLWIFCETLAGIIREHTIHMSQLGKTMLRVALGALGALMVPLVASRVVEGWYWPAGTFVFVYLLFFSTGMAFALVARRIGVLSYKAGVAVSLIAGFALGWSNMVQLTGLENPAYLIYYSVLVVGAIGAWLARLEPSGLSVTLFAMAAVLALISFILPPGAPPDVAWRMALGHGVYVVLFAASGLLFRHASLAVKHDNRKEAAR